MGSRTLAIGIVSLTLAACGSAPVSADAPRAPRGAACEGAKDPLHPFIVTWSAANKVGLDAASRRGVVAVAYEGCALRVVGACEIAGHYEETATKPERRTIAMHDEKELLATLPLSAPQLGAGFASGDSLVLDSVVVSERTVRDGPIELSGDCGGATHYVKSIRLGAYTLESRADASASAHADLGPLTAGGSRTESDSRRKASGDPAACEAAPTNPSCAAPVALELVPIERDAPRPGSETMMMHDR